MATTKFGYVQTYIFRSKSYICPHFNFTIHAVNSVISHSKMSIVVWVIRLCVHEVRVSEVMATVIQIAPTRVSNVIT